MFSIKVLFLLNKKLNSSERFLTGQRSYLQAWNRGCINTERCVADEVIPQVSEQKEVNRGEAAGRRWSRGLLSLCFMKQNASLTAPCFI